MVSTTGQVFSHPTVSVRMRRAAQHNSTSLKSCTGLKKGGFEIWKLVCSEPSSDLSCDWGAHKNKPALWDQSSVRETVSKWISCDPWHLASGFSWWSRPTANSLCHPARPLAQVRNTILLPQLGQPKAGQLVTAQGHTLNRKQGFLSWCNSPLWWARSAKDFVKVMGFGCSWKWDDNNNIQFLYNLSPLFQLSVKVPRCKFFFFFKYLHTKIIGIQAFWGLVWICCSQHVSHIAKASFLWKMEWVGCGQAQ